MSETPFQKIMGLLSQLSRAELSTVAFHAQSLSVGGAPGNRGRPSGNPKKGRTGKAGGDAKASPAKQVSPYASNPAYVAFKEADKALNAVLKERKISLKEIQKTDASHPAVREFFAARDLWFREKAALAVKPTAPAGGSASSAASSAPAKPEAKKEG
jgi:hypothetical protein